MKHINHAVPLPPLHLLHGAGMHRSLGRVAAIMILAGPLLMAQQTFYYKKGQKIPLEVDHSKTFVLFAPETTKATLESATGPAQASVEKFETLEAPENINVVANPGPPRQKWAIIDNKEAAFQPLAQAPVADKVEYQAPFFLTEDKKRIGMSHLLYVKLKDPGDKAKLEALAAELKVDILGNNKQMPLWYTLACKKESAGNALEVANRIFETKGFAAAEPDFLADFKIKEPADSCEQDDELFAQQWALRNTGQGGGRQGTDLGVCEAWKIATGKGVVVAVIDQGVDLNHPDLRANLFLGSFDTLTGQAPSRLYDDSDTAHGTACAGVIGAVRGNARLGVAGVAPDSRIMSVSDKLRLEPGAQQTLASGIAWAWQNGADVISNSWGHNDLASPLIDDAIEEALSKGRQNKGCVVLFAAGNSNGPVMYPANSNPAILAVGAMSPCGERKSPASCDREDWGSCFGRELDVLAPGVLIATTDHTGSRGYNPGGDFHLKFRGTSAATPHVAAVAALILEANPQLKQGDVVRIIEGTARQTGGYSYQPVANRPNGLWNREAGHGLVDAKACVDAARASRQPGP